MKLTAKIASIASALGFSLLLSFNASASTSVEAIVERIQPVGQVCMEGDESCGSVAAAAASGGAARTGEEVFNTKCTACHSTGAAGAPVYGTADWAERGAKGIDALLATAISGIGAMPAKGLCSDCSDEELKGAVEYMVNSAP